MKTISALDVATETPKAFGAGRATLFPVANARPRIRRRNLLPLSEAISIGFAISSPLLGLIIGFLGAWFVTWLTS